MRNATMRSDERKFDRIRPIAILPDYMEFADGSALIEMGKTKVLATASLHS
jgi:ribonuclease PH